MSLYSQASLDAIDEAILQAAQGKSVAFADRSWTSQDLPALRELRAEIARAVNATPTHRLASTQKGV